MKYSVSMLITNIGMRKMTFVALSCMLLQVGNVEAKTKTDKKEVLETTQSEAKITGTIVDDLGDPVIGANVSVKGTTKGTITDIDGKFILDGVRANGTIVVSYVGMATQEIAVGGKTVFNVKLASSDVKLEEVVVTALGMKREKKALGYSVAELKGDEMTRVTQTNVLGSLAGKVSGVQINTTGSGPNSSVSMVIRGIRSLNSDNQPLFVIDGVPVQNTLNNVSEVGSGNRVDYGNAISDLNPNDIENISVLKGPSAAALYGSRAGNGVVLVTTKSGKKSKGLGVSVSSSTEFNNPVSFFPVITDRAVGYRDVPYVHGTQNVYPYGFMEGSALSYFGPKLDQGTKMVQWNSPLDESGKAIPTELVGYGNNLKNFVQTGLTSTNSVALENQSEKMDFRLAYTNTTSQGIVPTTDLSRNTLNLNFTYRILENLSLSSVININRSGSSNIAAGANGMNPLEAAAFTSSYVNINDLQDYWYSGVQQRLPIPINPKTGKYVSDKLNNPYFIVNENKNSFLRNRVYGNLKLNYELNDKFSVQLRYAHDQFNEKRETKIAVSTSGQQKGGYGLQNLFTYEGNSDILLNYKNKWNDFSFNASLGGNIMYQQTDNNFAGSKNGNGTGLIVPHLYTMSNILATDIQYNSYFAKKTIYSVYGMVSLGWKDIVYLDLTARNDWSSTLPSSNRSFFYPSGSLSLLVNNMVDLGDKVSLLKLRGGLAQVGKDVSPYQLYSTYGAGSWGGSIGTNWEDRTMPNVNLKPEIATSFEGGFDVAFFNNRLRADFTAYQSDNRNQALSTRIPSGTGYSSQLINAGLIRSWGYEASVGGTIIDTKDWQWDVTANYTYNRSKIKELTPEMSSFEFWDAGRGGAWTYAEGQIVPSTGLPSTGIIGEIWDDAVLRAPEGTLSKQGNDVSGWPVVKYAQQESTRQATSGFDKKVVIGNFNPDFMMGFQTTLKWKFLTLNASFDWRCGGQFFSQTYRYFESNRMAARQATGNAYDLGLRDANGNPALVDHATGVTAESIIRANPDKFMNGFNAVGGADKEHGGYFYSFVGNTALDGQYDGAFIPGVYINDKGEYIENIGGAGTVMNALPLAIGTWNFNKAALFDADYIKLREISVDWKLPKKWLDKILISDLSLGVFSRNIMLWSAAGNGIDPETAYQPDANAQAGMQLRQGVERFNLSPMTVPVGIKLNFNF